MSMEELITGWQSATPSTRHRVMDVLKGIDRQAEKKDAKPEMRLVSFTGAARLTSLSRSSIYALVRQGRLDVVELSGARKITMRSINEFLEGRRPTNAATAKQIEANAAKYRKAKKED